MLLNPSTFLIGRAIAQNRGVDSATATRDALVGSIIKPPMLGVVLVSAIAQNQSGPPPANAVTGGSSYSNNEPPPPNKMITQKT